MGAATTMNLHTDLYIYIQTPVEKAPGGTSIPYAYSNRK
jgi:hypothetical protein